MKIKQLKNGMFSAVISMGFDENGKRVQKRITANTKWEVQKIADELVTNKIDIASQELTVEQAMIEYVECRSNLIEATTLRNYNEIIRNRLATIKNVKIKQLRIIDIQRAINKEASMGLSRRTVKNGVSLLKASLEFFDINLNFKKLQYPKDIPKAEEALPELTEVFALLKGTSIEVYCALAFNGCMRIGEVLGLKFSDLDYETHTLHIHRTQIVTDNGIAYRDYCKTPKSIRKIELSAELCEQIKKLPHSSEDEFIVPLTRKALYSRYARIMKRNGLPTKFHLIRKMSASALHASGMPDKYILYLGGWSTDNVLKSVYEKTFESERDIANRQAVLCFEKINEQINNNVSQ
ncbi:MAG: site-specific integrase [Ruminococcus sp.]|nr:site-specific integrase [Ruminococcus sp.]